MDEHEEIETEKKPVQPAQKERKRDQDKSIIVNETDSLNWLAHQYFIRGEYEECLEVLSKYSKNKNGYESPYALFIRAMIKRAGGDINQSQELLKKCYNLNQSSTSVLRELARSFLLLGKYKMSLELYDTLLQKNEEDWDALYHKGVIYTNMRNYNEASASLESALNLNRNEEIIKAQGRLALLNQNYQAAIEKYEEALDLTPNNSDLFTSIGSLYLKMNDYDKAFENFTQAMKIDQKYSNSLLGMASIYQYQGEFENALSMYKQSSVTHPNSALVWNNLGLCFFAKNKFITAAACLKKAIYLDPFEWIIAFNLGLVYTTTKQFASAFIYMNTAANLKQNYPQILMYLGIILSELSDIYNASSYYDKAIKIKEDYLIYFNYTVSLMKNEMIGNAKEKFLKFRQLYEKERGAGTEENQMIEEMLPILMEKLG